MSEHYDLRCGHVLDVLRAIPDESVHCVVTSPPYWGLRDYGTEPQVWGGLATCRHEWGHRHTVRDIREAITTGKTRTTDRFYGDESRRFNGNHQKITDGQFCQSCAAWYGSLGLEPTPWLYIEHLTTVFAEVRRVLRANGACWLNLGDCYATGAGKVGNCPGGGRQGERWTKHSAGVIGPMTQPNRMPQVGLKPKDLCMIPHRVAIALQEDGWWVRMDVAWNKSNPMPESVTDRPTRSHEYVFLLAKSARYYYDAGAIKEPAAPDSIARYERGRSDDHKWADGGPGNQTIAKSFEHMRSRDNFRRTTKEAENITGGPRQHREERTDTFPTGFRNKRSVWSIATQPVPEAHFAAYPIALAETCILAGCPVDGTVLDPFSGSGTTGLAALKHGRRYLGIELSEKYVEISYERARKHCPLLVWRESSEASA